MYIGWILLIVFGGLGILTGIMGLVLFFNAEKEWNKYCEHYSQYKQEIIDKHEKSYDKKRKIMWTISIFAIIMAIGLFICVMVVPVNYCSARDEYATFIETQELVETVYSGEYTEYENAGLNTKIVEVNQWLAQARASKKNWGICSIYYSFDLDSLEYIKLVKGEQE